MLLANVFGNPSLPSFPVCSSATRWWWCQSGSKWARWWQALRCPFASIICQSLNFVTFRHFLCCFSILTYKVLTVGLNLYSLILCVSSHLQLLKMNFLDSRNAWTIYSTKYLYLNRLWHNRHYLIWFTKVCNYKHHLHHLKRWRF